MIDSNDSIYIKNAKYFVYAVFIFYSGMMIVTTALLDWSSWIICYTVAVALLVSFVTFARKISPGFGMYLIATATMLNVTVFSWAENSFYQSGIVICGVTLLLSLYMNIRLIIYNAFMSVALMAVHLLVFRTIPFETTADVCNFLMRIPALFAVQILLAVVIYKINLSHVSLASSAEKAMRAEQSKSEFLANMSHEIRTPMNAIVGICEIILRDHNISDSVREDCYNIQASGRSLLSIINDILDFSKIESGKMELVEQEYNIASTLNDVINMAMTRKGSKKIEIIVQVDPDIPSGLIGDEIRIRQIIVNLITNAVKFTNQGAVTLKISQTVQEYGINLNVAVIDSGIGITPENLEKLFTSFQQVDTKKNRSIEGTGLGLAISKKLITSMCGFISVRSEYGKGSEFRFVIPQKVANQEPFICVKNAESVNAVGYIDMHKFDNPVTPMKYKELITDMINGLHVKCRWFSNADALKEAIATDTITHCFIGKEEYISNKEYFAAAAKKCEVIIVQDRVNAVIPGDNMKCIYKPFYALSVVSALNNESVVLNINERRGAMIRFIAPKARVLIVDDNIINLKVAVGLMRPYRMQMMTAESAKAAIAMLRSKDIDIVFMDHMMPDIDGVEATQMIREMDDEYYKKLPIIALTANAINGVHEMFLAAGLNDFIAKPIELSALDRVLKKWLPPQSILVPSSDDFRATEPQRATPSVDTNDFFNPDNGLVYTGGDTDTYLDILDIFIRKADGKIEFINGLFDKEDWKNYVIEVHALKSSARAIGASQLSELAKRLELAGKAGDYKVIVEENAELMKQYKLVAEEAKKHFNLKRPKPAAETEAVSAEPLPELDTEHLDGYIAQIIEAADNFDGDEVVRIVKEASEYVCNGFVLSKLLDGVRVLAEDFEYDEIKPALEKITEKLRMK